MACPLKMLPHYGPGFGKRQPQLWNALSKSRSLFEVQRTPQRRPQLAKAFPFTLKVLLRNGAEFLLIQTAEDQRAILDYSSKLHGIRLPLLTSPPDDLRPGVLFEYVILDLTRREGQLNQCGRDPDGQPPLSDRHLLLDAQWKRPTEIWPEGSFRMSGSNLPSTGIYQRLVTDCSVVAAMALCWEHHLRFQSRVRPHLRQTS